MPALRRIGWLVLLVALGTALIAGVRWITFRPGEAPLGPAGPIVPVPVPSGGAVLVGAGDIARCDSDADEATARLLDSIAGTVFTAGDNAYDEGTEGQFRDCYDPTWGRHRARTLPVAGNHDWLTQRARGYRTYFGRAAAPDGQTWYATDVGTWRVIVLDSDCDNVGGCEDGSAQMAWLRDELASRPAVCSLALWHRPRFSSGQHGDEPRMAAFWRELHGAGVEALVSGHDHDYERFEPLDGDGRPDPASGVRQFVVGTGGAPLRAFEDPRPGSVVRDSSSHGVLRLVLWPDRYEWGFIPVAGREFRDDGAGTCR